MEAEGRGQGKSVFSVLAFALLVVMIVPLIASIAIWRFGYSVNSNWALGLAQIRNSLDGAAEFMRLQGDFEGTEASPETIARVKRVLNGPVAAVRIGPSSPGEAASAIEPLLSGRSLRFSKDAVYDWFGRLCGRANGDGTWTISGEDAVAHIELNWNRLSEAERREFANRHAHVQVSRDSSKAIIRVGASGYIWAINASRGAGARSYEVIHPQIEAVEVTNLANSHGELVGADIGALAGRVKPTGVAGIYRYDYFWKNPEDSRERKKIVLMRFVERWNVVLCAGLYEDEYFQPARIAEAMFISLVVLIGGVTLSFSFFFAGRISKALNALAGFTRQTADSEGFVHSLEKTGIRELDALSSAMRYMEEKINERELSLQRELAEKNTLIEEVHHRVKNNLAVLSSIISLQRGQVQGNEAALTLSLLSARVNSMALVYQQLMGSDEYTALPFDQYLEGLLSYHQSSVSAENRSVIRTERLDPIFISFDSAVPLGLIANELLSNAYLHGIPTQGAQEIRVELTGGSGACELAVSDNGPGFPSGAQEKTGLLMVRALCSQVRAELFLSRPGGSSGGTRAAIRWTP